MTQPVSYSQRLHQSLGILPIAERMANKVITLLDTHIGQGATRGVVYHASYEIPEVIRALPDGPLLDMALTQINAAFNQHLPPTDNWTVTIFSDYNAGEPTASITTVVDVVGHTVVSSKTPDMATFQAKGFAVQIDRQLVRL